MGSRGPASHELTEALKRNLYRDTSWVLRPFHLRFAIDNNS